MADTVLVRLKAIGAKRFSADMDDAGQSVAGLDRHGRRGAGGLLALEGASNRSVSSVRTLMVVCGAFAAAQGVGALISGAGAGVVALGALGVAALGAGAAFALFGMGAVAWFKQMQSVGGSAASALAAEFTNFKSIIAAELGPAFDPVFRAMAAALTPIAGLVREIAPAFSILGRAIAGGVTQATTALAGMGPQISGLLRGTAGLVPSFVAAVTQLARVLLVVANAALPYLARGLQWAADGLAGLSSRGVTGAVNRAFTTLSAVLSAVGGAIRASAPLLRALFDGIRQIGQSALPGFIGGLQAIGPAFQAIASSGALATLGDVVGKTFAFLAQVVSTVITELQRVGLLKPVILGLVGAFVAWQVATTALSVVMAVLAMNPVVLVIGAIAALVVGIIYAYRRFEGFRNVVNSVIGFLGRLASTALRVGGRVVSYLVKPYTALGGLLLGPLRKGFGAMWRFLGSVVTQAYGVGKDVVAGFVRGIRGIGSAIAGIFKGGLGFAGDVGRSILDWINKVTPFGDKISIPGPIPDIKLPALATGGRILSGGLALVGENGPEIVSLGAGSAVHPNDSALTQAATTASLRPAGPSGGATASVPASGAGRDRWFLPVRLDVDGRAMAEKVVEAIEDKRLGMA